MSKEPLHKRLCQAMVDAGIEDPESQDGKDFCTEKCPYPNGCIVFEYGRGISSLRRDKRVARAREMAAESYPNKDIAQELRVSVRSVERYLAD